MRRKSTHQASRITFTPLAGGINTADRADRIADGEMTDCTNFLYGSGTLALTPRGGLVKLHTFPSPIRALHYDVDTNTLFVFLTDRSVYIRIGSGGIKHIGTTTGTKAPSCTKFMDKLYIASGDRLQSYDYAGTLTDIQAAPIADIVLVRSGRLCTARTGSDRISYSAIGDGMSWEQNTNDGSSGGWIDIGYGDSGDITAVIPLATDLIIIKSNGNIYQFSGDGDPNEWRVTPLATDADPVGTRTAAHLQGAVVYLSSRGLVSLNATQDYGNITARDLGDKFRSLLASPHTSAQFFPLRRAQLLLIRAHDDKRDLCAFHTALGVATHLTFARPVDYIAETAEDRLLASGADLYRWTSETATDDGSPITYRIGVKHLYGAHPLHLGRIDARLSSDHESTVQLTAEGHRPLTASLNSNGRTARQTNHSAPHIAITLSADAPFTVDDLSVDVSEL